MTPTTTEAALVATFSARSGVRFHKPTCKRIVDADRITPGKAYGLGGGKPATCCKPKPETVDAVMGPFALAAAGIKPDEVIPATPAQAEARTGKAPELTQSQKADGMAAGIAAVLNGGNPEKVADDMVAAAAEGKTLAHPQSPAEEAAKVQLHHAARRAFDAMTPAAQAAVRDEAHRLMDGTRDTNTAWGEAITKAAARPRSRAAAKAQAESTKAAEPGRRARRAAQEQAAASDRVDELVEAAKAKATREQAEAKPDPGPTVTYYVNGRPRQVRTSPRPYTFSYLAGEVIGGKGSSGRLRDLLAAAGITDPEHTNWDHTLENGKTIGGRLPGATPPAAPAKPAKADKKAAAAAKITALNEAKAEAKARKEAKTAAAATA